MANGSDLWEDHLLERKTEGDLKDLRKTMVALANTVRPGHTAQILLGEKDDGAVQGIQNPDNIQKKVRSEAEQIYPPIVWRTQVYEKDGKNCIRVEIEYSGETPHFSGPAWVRRGSETIKASEEVFQRLINVRTSKVRELEQWIGKEVSIIPPRFSNAIQWGAKSVLVESVTEFYVILRVVMPLVEHRRAFSMRSVDLNWDTEKQRLTIVPLDL